MKINEHNSSTSIYLQQIQNFVDLGQGYNTVRQHLFKQLNKIKNQQNLSEDSLADSIAVSLAQHLKHANTFHQALKTHRTLQLIQDLLTYAEQTMSQAMHIQPFVQALADTATPRIISFNSELDTQNRKRAMGVFMFWENQYASNQEKHFQLFEMHFRKLLNNKKILLPSTNVITPNKMYQQKGQNTKNQQQKDLKADNSIAIILQDIDLFTNQTQNAAKSSVKSITNTQYVRLIKHKSKILHNFTTQPSGLSQQHKNKIKDLYKRLRTVLKEIDKYNQSHVQTKKASQQQRQYVEKKITPKKQQKSADVVTQNTNLLQNNQIIKIATNQTQKPKGQTISPKKLTTKVQKIDFDLLDISPPSPNKTTSTQAAFKTFQEIQKKSPKKVQSPKKLQSPQKQEQKVTDLLSGTTQPKQQEQFVDGILIETATPSKKPSKTEQQELMEVFSTPSAKGNNQAEDQQQKMAKMPSNRSADSHHSNLSFQNNNKKENSYSGLPVNQNLSPNSSGSDQDEKVQQKTGFNLFGLFGNERAINNKQIYQEAIKYDDAPLKELMRAQSNTNKGSELLQVNFLEQQKKSHQEVLKKTEENKPLKPVIAIDYSKYAIATSPSKSQGDQQQKLGNDHGDNKELQEVDLGSPSSEEKHRIDGA